MTVAWASTRLHTTCIASGGEALREWMTDGRIPRGGGGGTAERPAPFGNLVYLEIERIEEG